MSATTTDRRPRVLVACEYSGKVRDAFAARGWDAWSCDLLPTDAPGQHHQGDVTELLGQSWDLLIGHPPCTYLTAAGARHLYTGKSKAENIALGYQRDPERWANLAEGAQFFRTLLDADVPFRAIENPKMLKPAVDIIGRRQDQILQPYEYGHPETKGTGLWLVNLPPLTPTSNVKAHMDTLPKKESNRVHYASPGADRWKLRSTTFSGIAQAMADQWGPYIEKKIGISE